MSDAPSPGSEDRTVRMTARTAMAPASDSTTPQPTRKRPVRLYAGAGIVLIAALAGGAWLLLRDTRPEQPVSAGTASTPEAAPAAPSRPPRALPPFSPTRMVDEVFEGRDPGHSVSASVEKARVRIGQDSLRFSINSSKPGYVYVLVVGTNRSDFDLLFPNTVDTNNRIRPGQTLTLPGPQWPLRAQGPPGTSRFVAIVSHEPRDFSDLAPPPEGMFQKFPLAVGAELYLHHAGPSPLFAGKVVCASSASCSESYGAAVFSIEQAGLESEARDPVAAPRPPAAARTPAVPRAPATREASPPAGTRSGRCSDLLQRASLGDPLTVEEQTTLKRDCR